MKFWKHSVVSVFAFLGVMSTVLYTACEKDACDNLKCKNMAPCVDGFCKCPTGYEGAECNDWASAKFVGFYDGSTRCGTLGYNIDSALIEQVGRPDSIAFKLFSDPDDIVYIGKVKEHEFIYTDANGTYVQVIEDGTKITAYIERTLNGERQRCQFIGTAR